MSETARYMLVRGTAAARAGDHAEARRYLERALYNGATREQTIEAHLWLSRIATDRDEQRDHLEDVLAGDPTHAEARRALAILDGRLDPADIVDPDHLSQKPAAPEEGQPQVSPAQRLICPQCAGRVRFEPGKTWIQCQYCGHRQPILTALQVHPQLEEQDFVVALATAKGHTLPTDAQVFRCQGCQATLLTSGRLTANCPYCGSAHIVAEDSITTIPPEGIIPFVSDELEAASAFRACLEKKLGRNAAHIRTTHPRGLYLPIWTFDIMGEVGWRGVENESSSTASGVGLSLAGGKLKLGKGRRGDLGGGAHVEEGTHYVMLNDIIVPGTHRVPFAISSVFRSFDLDRAVPYDTAFLSDWPAEVYEVAVSDASLVARRQAFDGAREKVRLQATDPSTGSLQKLQVFSRNLAVQAYKLVLVPIWLANYRHEATTYTVAVNGQNGGAFGEFPTRGLGRLLRDWLKP